MENAINVKTNTAEIRTNRKTHLTYRLVKRIFDFGSSLLLGMVLLIPVCFIAAVITVKDFGNPFYRQRRIGINGRPLYIYKFRSMKKGADNLLLTLTAEQLKEYKREYKLDDAPRLIGYKKAGDGKNCFGALLRSTSVDELPQILINICILGNMSVIGPRPILESELKEHYSPEEQELLLSDKPGLTGYLFSPILR